MAETITFVLDEKLDVDAPIFQRVNKDQRVKITKRPMWSPFLQITVQDAEGNTKNLRYKEASATIDLDEQIEVKKIPANAKYTNSERRDLNFRNGINVTNKVNLQTYLKNYPACEGSPYTSDDVPMICYKIYDKTNQDKIQNAETRKMVKAASKVLGLDLEQAQNMIIRLNGSFVVTPKPEDYTGTTEERIEAATGACQNMLMEFVDAADVAGWDAVLNDEINVDEQTTILIGKLLNNNVLEFDISTGRIVKNKNGKQIELKTIVADSLDEMKRMFSDFLNTTAGKTLKDDLEKDLKKSK